VTDALVELQNLYSSVRFRSPPPNITNKSRDLHRNRHHEPDHVARCL